MTRSGGTVNDSTLEIIDVSDPRQPVRASVFRAPYTVKQVTSRDSFLYLSTDEAGVLIIDARNPAMPVLRSRVLQTSDGIAVSDSFLYATAAGFFYVIKIANPDSPRVVGSTIHNFGSSFQMLRSPDYVYSSAGIFDVSDPAHPLALYDFPSSISGVWARDDFVVIAEGWQGLWTLRNKLVTVRDRESTSGVPGLLALHQNYPNPFNPSTTISFDLSMPGFIELVVYNLLGQKVRTLANGNHMPGHHKESWDGKDDGGRMVTSGVYFYKIMFNGKTQIRRMLLIK
ncbi:MAG: T9SS type A sorting domain-containing protein [Ignavibacteriae bacterium]|nr:T9SS type A sorting domain-containing protein [Ignavibacteriota bacterium]